MKLKTLFILIFLLITILVISLSELLQALAVI